MEAKELRVGNIVKFPFKANGDYEPIGDISRIVQDSGECEEYYISSVKDKFPRHISMIQPAYLTQEIIEKFGFGKCTDASGIYFSDYSDFVIRAIGSGWLVRAFCEIDGTEWSLRQIQYVHQLQNIVYAITGNELNLE